jgi:hypothetical protein
MGHHEACMDEIHHVHILETLAANTMYMYIQVQVHVHNVCGDHQHYMDMSIV